MHGIASISTIAALADVVTSLAASELDGDRHAKRAHLASEQELSSRQRDDVNNIIVPPYGEETHAVSENNHLRKRGSSKRKRDIDSSTDQLVARQETNFTSDTTTSANNSSHDLQEFIEKSSKQVNVSREGDTDTNFPREKLTVGSFKGIKTPTKVEHMQQRIMEGKGDVARNKPMVQSKDQLLNKPHDFWKRDSAQVIAEASQDQDTTSDTITDGEQTEENDICDYDAAKAADQHKVNRLTKRSCNWKRHESPHPPSPSPSARNPAAIASPQPTPKLAKGSPYSPDASGREKYRLAGVGEGNRDGEETSRDDEAMSTSNRPTRSTATRSTAAHATSGTPPSGHSHSNTPKSRGHRNHADKTRTSATPTSTTDSDAGNRLQESSGNASASGSNQQTESNGARALPSVSFGRALCYVLVAQALTAALAGT